MSRAKLDKIAKAIKGLQRRQVEHSGRRVYSDKALPLEYRTVKTVQGNAEMGMYRLTETEALDVTDILLGLGGASMIANVKPPDGWETPEETAAREQDLIDAGFVKGDDGRWTMPTPEAEIAFLQGWLGEADATGRTIKDRIAIERWIKHLRGNATVAPKLNAGPPPAPPSEPAASMDKVIAQRARDRDGVSNDELAAWKQAARSTPPPVPDEAKDALTRRNQRRAGR